MFKAKKLLSLFVGAAMMANIFATMPFTAFADEANFNSNNKATVEVQRGFEYVIQTKNLSIQSANPFINGAVQETDDLIDLDNSLMLMLDSNTQTISNGYFGGGDISTDSDIYSSDVYSASGGNVEINHNITTEKNIYLSGETVKGDDSILYSKNGDISINCNTLVNFKGIIYAPNGIVTINSANCIIDGIIIAKEVYVQANTFTINNNEEISQKLDDIAYMHIDQLISLYPNIDTDTNEVILEWNNNENIASVDIYRRYNNESSFQMIDSTSETEYHISSDTITNTADYKVIAQSKFNEEISSNVITFIRDENGISVGDVDTDKDGITDGYEISIGTDLLNVDTDKDGFSDGYELNILYTDPLSANVDDDFDNDGLTNLQEMSLGTNPYLEDSDFDGISDNSDSTPLKTDIRSTEQLNGDIPLKTNEFDLVARYFDDNGNKCEIIYNYLTNAIKYTSDIKRKTYNIYDNRSNLSAEINIVNGNTIVNSYSYDTNDNIASIATNGFRYDFNYDQNGDMNSVSIGDKVLLTNGYDNNNENLISETYGNGDETEFKYDENGNIVSQKINGDEVYKWSYDDEGKLFMYSDLLENVNYTYSYDEENNIKSVTSDKGFSINYNEVDDVYSVTYINGEVTKTNSIISTTDELNNNITTMNLISGGKIISIISSETSESKTLYSNSNAIMDQMITYNDNGISKIEYQDGKSLEYSYDENGNIIAISENENKKISYVYDERDQLIRENNAYINETIIYTYDIAGNILATKTYAYTEGIPDNVISTKDYSYKNSEWKDLLTNFNGDDITYDEIGNPLSYRDGMRFKWTNRQLDSIIINNKKIDYQYNENGIRTSKTIDGVKTSFQLDETKIISESTSDDMKWYIYDSDNSIIGFEYKEIAYYFEKNAQGDVSRVFDAYGNFICEYVYDAWGNTISVIGDKNIAYANPFRYRGYYFDDESGLYYLQSRYYDCYTGRFINTDNSNLIEKGEYNLYRYCSNNPISYVDTDGRWKYNRNKARDYALKWANYFNTKKYPDLSLSGGDCANFVSQCLFAGGFKMKTNSLIRTLSWYMEKGIFNIWNFSASWVKAPKQHGFLMATAANKEYKIKNKSDLNKYIKKIKVGDVAYLDLNKDGYLDHAIIITLVTNRSICYSAHSKARRNYSLMNTINQGSVAYILSLKDNINY